MTNTPISNPKWVFPIASLHDQRLFVRIGRKKNIGDWSKPIIQIGLVGISVFWIQTLSKCEFLSEYQA